MTQTFHPSLSKLEANRSQRCTSCNGLINPNSLCYNIENRNDKGNNIADTFMCHGCGSFYEILSKNSMTPESCETIHLKVISLISDKLENKTLIHSIESFRVKNVNQQKIIKQLQKDKLSSGKAGIWLMVAAISAFTVYNFL